MFRNNKAQCFLGTLFGKLGNEFKCVSSIVLKRKQGLSAEKAEKAGGNVVDLPPTRLEGYGLELAVKRVATATDKQFHLAADGDMKVRFIIIICHLQHLHH